MNVAFRQLIKTLTGCFGLLVSIMGYSQSVSNGFLSIISMILSITLCWHVVKNRLLLVIGLVLLYLCYSIYYVNYFSPLLTTMYTVNRNTPEAGIALSSLVLFLSCVLIAIPTQISLFGMNGDIFQKRESNVPFVIAILIALLLILVYGFSRPEGLGEERGEPSAIYEYSVIIFILGFYFAGDSKGLNGTLCVVLGLFAIQNIIYGGRVMALQLLLVAFFVFLSKRISTKSFFLLIILGLIVFTFFGVIRTGITDANSDDFIQALTDSLSRGFAWDTAYSAWHTSTTFILYGNSIDSLERLKLFGQWVCSIVLGSSVDSSQLPLITRDYFFHNYGGVLPIYFQFYLGPIGVAAIGIYVSLIIRFINYVCIESVNKRERSLGQVVASCCVIYITVSCFRWILYSPSQITRGLLLCILASAVLVFLNYRMSEARSISK